MNAVMVEPISAEKQPKVSSESEEVGTDKPEKSTLLKQIGCVILEIVLWPGIIAILLFFAYLLLKVFAYPIIEWLDVRIADWFYRRR